MHFQNVLRKTKPTPKEVDEIHKILGRLNDETSKLGYKGVAVGSIGKHTWLKGDYDIDWFIFFPKETSRKDLEKKGLAIGKKLSIIFKGKCQVKYAEHPYTRVLLKKYHIDVVPCYKIEKGEKIISAVDRSPLHLKFVHDELPAKNQDEVRLLKQFMKGIGVYGSDLKRNGFSGYIAELLIIKYGSFNAVIKEAGRWKPGITISIIESNAKIREKSPLILVDPVDHARNVAAAVSEENFLYFVSSCHSFMKKPALDYFYPRNLPLSQKEISFLASRGTFWFTFVGKSPDIVDDILWPQMRRASSRIASLLRHNDFEVYTSDVFANKNMILFFELEEGKKPAAERMQGPPVYAVDHLKEFLKKYAGKDFGVFIEGENVVAYRKRPMQLASEIAKFRKLSVYELHNLGIPKNIANAFRKSSYIDQKKFWSFVRKNKELSISMRKKYFEKTMK